MSKSTIERQIVQMVFEAKAFRKGIRESLEDLSDFKKAFELENAQRSLSELEKAADVDFSPMSKALDSINGKLGIMGVAAAAIVTKITQSIMAGGMKLVNALVLDPITSGLGEYETQLNAVQTILANTAKAGTTLSDVTDALAILNDYADLTIYNFTQMVDSIGKFTTAGVDLDTSVSAIKGIANVAAISGANAAQASTAMYQLSQAISSGIVRLQDWMSIENAGMGGEIFRSALMDTARVHGVAVDRIVEQNGSFRASLQEGWLSSDIMLETLEKFTGDLSDAQLEALGYTQEQIIEIQKVSQMALDAATKIKTLTALKDTLAEVLGSGWAQTWEIIFGDFEQAKKLWGSMADLFSGLIEGSTDARNDLLKTWAAAGGRSKFIKGMFNIIEFGIGVVRAFKDAFSEIFTGFTARNLLVLTNKFLAFSEQLRYGYSGLGKFKMIIKGVAAALDIMFMIISAVLSPLKALIPGLKEGAGGFLEWLVNFSNSIVAFREFAIETKFFDNIVADVLARVREFIAQTKELVDSFLKLEVVEKVITWFSDLSKSDFVNLWQGLLGVLSAVIAPFYLLAIGAQDLYKEIAKLAVVKQIAEYFQSISWEGIKNSFAGIADSARDLVDSVKDSDLIGKFVRLFQTFDGRRFRQFAEDAKEGFSWVDVIVENLKGLFDGLIPDMDKVREGIRGVFGSIGSGLGTALDYLIENAENIDYAKLFDILNKGLLAGVLLSIRKVFKGGILGGLFGESGEDIGESLGDMFEGLEGTLSSFQNNIRADTIQKIAIAIAILAGAITLLSLIDSTKLGAATTAIAVMIVTLFGSAGAMRLIRTQDAIKTAVAIVGLSVALAIASLALRNVSNIDPERMESSLLAMAAGLTALVISVNTLSAKTGTSMFKTIAILIGLGVALLVLSVAIRAFGKMDQDVLAQGLAAVAASLAMLVSAVAIISRTGDKGMIKAALGITIISGALLILAESVTKFGEMDVDTLQQGLISIGIVLVAFAGFTQLIKPKGLIKASVAITIMAGALFILEEAIQRYAVISWDELLHGLAGIAGVLLILVIAANAMSGAMMGALAIIVMSGALVILATALKLFATLSWEELAIGLVAMAATFVILGLAGLLLGPVIPVLLALGLAMTLIGLGAALFGVGLFLAATGLVAIAGSAALIAVAIGTVGRAVIEILPELAEGFAEALVSFVVTIAEKMPELIQAFKDIIIAMMGIFTDPEFIPVIVAGVFDFVTALLEAIAEKLPDLLTAGFDILKELLKGISDNIADVVAAGLEIITEFMAGIADGFPDLLLQAGETILVILEGIETAIDTYMAKIIAAGFRIAVAIIEGLVDGIKAGLVDIKAAIITMANEALAALGIPWDFGSPSKATWRMAKQVVLGFVLGIKDNLDMVDRAFDEFRERMQNRIDPLVQAIVNDLDKSVEFRPVISPVLDLDDVERGVKRLQGSRYASRILAAVDYEQGGGYASVPIGIAEETPTTQPTFVQYNYSPKALDRETLYRQTRTLTARLKEERAFA